MVNAQNPFQIKTCSLSAIATGQHANSLLELRDKLMTVEGASIYYHFWNARLNPGFSHPQFHNDFSSWIHHALHDHILSEQLNIIDPTDFDGVEDLRQHLIEKVERRLDEHEIVPWAAKDNKFNLIYSIIIVFDTSRKIIHPKELPEVIASLPTNSIYYHYIDAQTRTTDKWDDFSIWLQGFGGKYQNLIKEIRSIDPYFLTLTELRDELTLKTKHYFQENKNG